MMVDLKPYLHSEVANVIPIYRGHNSQNRPIPNLFIYLFREVFRIKNDLSSSKPPLIMVKFNNTSSRERFYNARLNLHKNSITTNSLGLNQSNKIFINEALSRAQRSLFYKARSTKTQLKWRYVWTYHGSIYMRENRQTNAIKITSEEELRQLSATTQTING